MQAVDTFTDYGYSSNSTVGILLTDTDLIKSMVQNLTCIDYAGASEIFLAFTKRAGRTEAQAHAVHPATMRKVLSVLPALPENPVSTDRYGYRYRVPHEMLLSIWSVLDADAHSRIRAKDSDAIVLDFAIMKTHKYRGTVDEQSRHATLREAVDAFEAMEFNGRSAIYRITRDEDGEEDFMELSWEAIEAELQQ